MSLLRRRAAVVTLVVLVAALLAAALAYRTAYRRERLPRGALWWVVQACELNQRVFRIGFPCLQVELPGERGPGMTVLRAPGSATHIVLVPTARIAGIESPEVLADAAGAFWREALAARRFVVEGSRGRVPLRAVALAINSAETRSQDQLHIHAECLHPRELAQLRAEARRAADGWLAFQDPMDGDRYDGRRVSRAELDQGNLFRLLLTAPEGGQGLARLKVFLIEESTVAGSFFVAVTSSDETSVESILDEGCRATLRGLAG
ncbi:MAG: CDP-diacylglycerol diphosphatase [Methylobacteriaceae bacterium]|nr:CDP-diacylglycerol diphosphatase [Methylobacteriaceae bacterium]